MAHLIKYPRTLHLPFSLGRSSDDKVLHSTEHFHGKQVVVTEKMDGENCSIYRDAIHARSLDSANHPSRAWVKQLQAAIGHDIPADYRLCGENMYAKHSIAYNNLPSYFMLFSIWDGQNNCLNWDSTEEWAKLLDIETVPVIYRGIYDEDFLINWYGKNAKNNVEGFVVRLAGSFHYNDFSKSVAKFVRPGHVQPDAKHWQTCEIVKNNLKS